MKPYQADVIEYLDPVIPRKDGQLAVPAVTGVRGKRIAFLENGWKSFVKMGERLEQILKNDHGIAAFRMYRISSSAAAPAALLDEVLRDYDAAIVGMAN